MKSVLLMAVLTLTSLSNVFAQNDNDLTLTGERWVAKYLNYVCDDGNTLAAETPAELADYDAEFYYLSTATKCAD